MKNVMELVVLPDSRIQTTILTTDGVTTMEIHRNGEKDDDVLMKMGNNNFYRSFKGTWEINMPQDSRSFAGPEFTDAASKALAYIDDRDNPNIYVVNYF